MNAAIQQVQRIVNQPVTRYARTSRRRVATCKPGWFHEGATKPDFNTVDVRATQEAIYDQHDYVTSDLNPGVVFVCAAKGCIVRAPFEKWCAPLRLLERSIEAPGHRSGVRIVKLAGALKWQVSGDRVPMHQVARSIEHNGIGAGCAIHLQPEAV